MSSPAFHHWYGPSHVVYGPGCTDSLASFVDELGCETAVVVTSRSVGRLPSVIDPVVEGLGERVGRVFEEVSIEKSYETVRTVVDHIEETDADVVVGLGGGSCMDLARAASVVAAHPSTTDPMAFFADVADAELVPSTLTAKPLPVVEVPTTLSGAEVTCAAGMNVTDAAGDHVPRRAPIIHEDIWPRGIFYDPKLAMETPASVIATSAMNGFDHGIEMLYSRNAVPMTDATAAHGLRLLGRSLPELGDDPTDVTAMGDAMVGVALATTGLIDPRTGVKYSLIHAFGHQIAQRYDVQQGLAHAAVAPHVLRYVFDGCDGRRELLGTALGVPAGTDGAVADGVIEAVERVRDGLGLPTRLRDIDGVRSSDFEALAASVADDIGVRFGPSELNPTIEGFHRVLWRSW